MLPSMVIELGTLPDWIESFGTAGALAFGFYQFDRRRRKEITQSRTLQAACITCWIEETDGSQEEVDCNMIVLNSSMEAASKVIVSFVIVKTLPTNASYMTTGEFLGESEFMLLALPPGKWRFPIRAGWRGMMASPGVQVAFTDSRNVSWIRYPDGHLAEQSTDIIESRHIDFPQHFSSPGAY